MARILTNCKRNSDGPTVANFPGLVLFIAAMLLASVDGLGQSSADPTWTETGGSEDMAVAVAAFKASSVPTLVGHAEAGNPSSASTAAINTTGATLLVAWTATEGADPTGFSDSYGNTWQALPAYSNGANSHARFFYAYNPTVGAGHTFQLSGSCPAIAVSAWSGMLTTSAVYQGSTGATNPSTASLASGPLLSSGAVLLITGWGSNGLYPTGLTVDQGFTMLGSVTNGYEWEVVSHAYLVSGLADPTWSETQAPEDFAVAIASFAASGTPTLVGHAEAGNPSSATTAAMNTTGATLLVAWTATEGADPTGFSDNKNNTWQALPVYANGAHSHGRFFYAYNPTMGPGHTFSLSGAYPAIAVSAWSGTLTTSAVYQDSTGATNPSTEWLAAGSPSSSGAVLLITSWASDSNYSAGLAVNSNFTILGSLTNGVVSEIVSHAYLVSGQADPTWSETGSSEDMVAAVAAFKASGVPTLVGHAEAGNASSATTAQMDTTGATLLVAWTATEGADPTGFSDNKNNTWQALPAYSNGANSHARFFYAYNPNVGAGHTFTLSGSCPAIAVSAWSGMLTTSAVYQGSTGATNPSTASLASGPLLSSGAVLLITGWGSNGLYPTGLTVDQGFTMLGSVTNGYEWEVVSHAYLVSGLADPTWSETQAPEDFAVAIASFAASGTPTLVGHAEAGNASSATTAQMNTSGATLLVAWTATEGADPTGFNDSYANTWQALPVYANGAHSHGRFFYAYSPTVGAGHTFSLSGAYPAIAVSAWSGTLTTSAVYQDSTGATNPSTEWLAAGSPSPSGAVLLITSWASDSNYSAGLAVNSNFTILGSVTNGVVSEIISHAYLASSTFTVSKESATVTLSNLTQTYTGSALTPTATTNPPGLSIVWTGAPDTNAGAYPVTATVNDPNYEGSASGTFTINKASDSTSVSSNSNPSTYQSPVTFTATVTGNSPTGTVTFYDGGTSIGTGTVGNGTATLTISTLVGGSHSITAAYGGDTNYTPSTSSTLTQSVLANSSTSLTSNLQPSTYGSPVTFTATVTGNSPTGTVTFYDFNGAVTLGSGTLNSGMATLTISTLTPGSHSITATYNGDGNNPASTSAVFGQTVYRHSMTLPSYCVY